jgi:hypothetical protein
LAQALQCISRVVVGHAHRELSSAQPDAKPTLSMAGKMTPSSITSSLGGSYVSLGGSWGGSDVSGASGGACRMVWKLAESGSDGRARSVAGRVERGRARETVPDCVPGWGMALRTVPKSHSASAAGP